MVVSARLTNPTLSTGASKRRIAMASLWLALGIPPGISCYCAIRHRAAKLRATLNKSPQWRAH